MVLETDISCYHIRFAVYLVRVINERVHVCHEVSCCQVSHWCMAHYLVIDLIMLTPASSGVNVTLIIHVERRWSFLVQGFHWMLFSILFIVMGEWMSKNKSNHFIHIHWLAIGEFNLKCNIIYWQDKPIPALPARLCKLIEAEWHIYASVNYISLVQIMTCRPGRRQAIICTNVGIVLIEPLWINFSEIFIQNWNIFIHEFVFESIICHSGSHLVLAWLC